MKLLDWLDDIWWSSGHAHIVMVIVFVLVAVCLVGAALALGGLGIE